MSTRASVHLSFRQPSIRPNVRQPSIRPIIWPSTSPPELSPILALFSKDQTQLVQTYPTALLTILLPLLKTSQPTKPALAHLISCWFIGSLIWLSLDHLAVPNPCCRQSARLHGLAEAHEHSGFDRVCPSRQPSTSRAPHSSPIHQSTHWLICPSVCPPTPKLQEGRPQLYPPPSCRHDPASTQLSPMEVVPPPPPCHVGSLARRWHPTSLARHLAGSSPRQSVTSSSRHLVGSLARHPITSSTRWLASSSARRPITSTARWVVRPLARPLVTSLTRPFWLARHPLTSSTRHLITLLAHHFIGSLDRRIIGSLDHHPVGSSARWPVTCQLVGSQLVSSSAWPVTSLALHIIGSSPRWLVTPSARWLVGSKQYSH